MTNSPAETIDPLLDKFLNRLFSHLDEQKLVFDGLNCRSAKKGTKRRAGGYYQRYITNFDGGLQFIGNFMDSLERALHISVETAPVYNYVFPTEEDIEGFIKLNNWELCRYQIRQNILNDSSENIDDWLHDITREIVKGNHYPNDRVRFITSKVGSGKTTFVNYLFTKYGKHLQEQRIVLARVNYQDFEFKKAIPNTINKFIRQLIIRKCVEYYLSQTEVQTVIQQVPEFIELLNLKEDDAVRDEIRQILVDTIDTPSEKSRRLEELKFYRGEENSERCINKYFKYLSRRVTDGSIHFLIMIDGFDALDPEMLQRYYLYIEELKDVMYSNLLGVQVNYILTLRTCTYEIFGRDNTNMKYLVAPNERAILSSSLDFVACDKQFSEKTKDIFTQMFFRIFNQIEKIFQSRQYNMTVVQIFDYNYRLLLRYLEQIIYFAIDGYIQKYRDISSLDMLAEYISINDYATFEKWLETKWYIILDILLIKSRGFYTHPYELKSKDYKQSTYTIKNTRDFGDEGKNKDILSFIDDVYNYILTEDMVTSDSIFPLLLKIRILQLYSLEDGYVSSDDIRNKLAKLGYKTKYFDSILDDLHNAKFLKVICDSGPGSKDCIKKYNITNRGHITINELGLSEPYINHVIPMVLLPTNTIVRSVSPYLYLEKMRVAADEALTVNYSFFINVIRSIEEREKANIAGDKYFESIFIADRIHAKYKKSLKKIVTHKRKIENDEFERNMEQICTAIDWR